MFNISCFDFGAADDIVVFCGYLKTKNIVTLPSSHAPRPSARLRLLLKCEMMGRATSDKQIWVAREEDQLINI